MDSEKAVEYLNAKRNQQENGYNRSSYGSRVMSPKVKSQGILSPATGNRSGSFVLSP
jgi:hypothetical protein